MLVLLELASTMGEGPVLWRCWAVGRGSLGNRLAL